MPGLALRLIFLSFLIGLAPELDSPRGMPREPIRVIVIGGGFMLIRLARRPFSVSDEDDFHNALNLVSSGVTQSLRNHPKLGMRLLRYIAIEHQASERLVLVAKMLIFIFQFTQAAG